MGQEGWHCNVEVGVNAYLFSAFNFWQLSHNGLPPVPSTRLRGGISPPGPHFELSWWRCSFLEWNGYTFGMLSLG